jgi:dipeptidyl aminopeptidase/acylaminoacyl peptidase
MKKLVCLLIVVSTLAGCKEQRETTSKHEDAVVLTVAAAKQARLLLARDNKRYLRVAPDDDSGFRLAFESERDATNDEVTDSQGLFILVDRKTRAMLPGRVVVDFVETADRFAFRLEGQQQAVRNASFPLADARSGFRTKLARPRTRARAAAVPPPELFRIVHYDAQPGKLAAYLSPDPRDGQRHPAIIWITGGDCNSIGRECWQENALPFDQTAGEYRKAGMVMMFPALRGGNDNPGEEEWFYGEVNDLLDALKFLREQPYVDPYRIYLGGHSTGGTLALLTAECADGFRAVFAFGPVEDPAAYPTQYNPFGSSDPGNYDPKERELRAPGRWLDAIRTPVFVIDGEEGNVGDLRSMQRSTKNPNLHFLAVPDTDHFRLLPAANRLIADKILADTGPTCNLSLTEEDLGRKPRQ